MTERLNSLRVHESEGIWIAYYLDGSCFVPFKEEIDALRYAVGRSMYVAFVAFKTELNASTFDKIHGNKVAIK